MEWFGASETQRSSAKEAAGISGMSAYPTPRDSPLSGSAMLLRSAPQLPGLSEAQGSVSQEQGGRDIESYALSTSAQPPHSAPQLASPRSAPQLRIKWLREDDRLQEQGVNNAEDSFNRSSMDVHPRAPLLFMQVEFENALLKEQARSGKGALKVEDYPPSNCGTNLQTVEQENVSLQSQLLSIKSRAGLLKNDSAMFPSWARTLISMNKDLELLRERRREIQQNYADRIKGLQLLLWQEQAQAAKSEAQLDAAGPAITDAQLLEAQAELSMAAVTHNELKQELSVLQKAKSMQSELTAGTEPQIALSRSASEVSAGVAPAEASELASEIQQLRSQLEALQKGRQPQSRLEVDSNYEFRERPAAAQELDTLPHEVTTPRVVLESLRPKVTTPRVA